MRVILSINSARGFQEYLLPVANDQEYVILLRKDVFGLSHNVSLTLEAAGSRWFFQESNEYYLEWVHQAQQRDEKSLRGDDLLRINFLGGDILSVMISEMEYALTVFDKYELKDCQSISIGKDAGNDIQYDVRNLISREHAVLLRNGEGFSLEDRSKNGVFVNAVRMSGRRTLNFGDRISIFGLELVYLEVALAVRTYGKHIVVNEEKLKRYVQEDASAVVSGEYRKDGHVLYHRSPRPMYKLTGEEIEIEAPPQPQTLNRKPLRLIVGPSMTMALPMLLGCGLAMYSTRLHGGGNAFLYTGLVTAVSSALIGTVWTLVNLRYETRKNREEELHRFETYGEYLIRCSNEIQEKYEKNTLHMITMYCPAEECCEYDGNHSLLWNRNIGHADFLSVRLGTGELPFQVPIHIPKERFTLIEDSLAEKPRMIRDSYRLLHDVPICVDLLKHRLVGIVGGEEKRGAVAVLQNLIAQITTSNCYTDIKIAVIYDEVNKDSIDWSFFKWLPHVWSEDKQTRYIASNKNEAGDVLYELTKVFRTRAEQEESSGKVIKFQPQYILFVADAELLEGELITSYIYEKETNYGLTTVFLVDDCESLPNACGYIIQNDETFQGMYQITDDIEERMQIHFDYLAKGKLEALARRLANIEVKEQEMSGDIPSALSFLDMYKVNSLEELRVAERWRKNRTYESMRVLIGEKAGGASWYLDIHEKYHGPHGLVAGTTGSGKSEVLQTYILSLAVNFSPEDVGFFIIDYKGGGMANLFDRLPHMIGTISNLSGNQIRRAMLSIQSENRRRQRLLSEYGVNHINLYTQLYKNHEARVPMPHLFLIIDEFAELKREEPDFMRELISVAQVGRSLGVHLILATQKPSGTVDDNIWSNSKFRLCLRVQDRQDSNDMLHRPEAAYITQAGRCYMQVGNDELFELFQSGYSGEIYNEEGGGQRSELARMVSLTGKTALVGNRAKRRRMEQQRLVWITEMLRILTECQGEWEREAAKPEKKCLCKLLQRRGLDYPASESNGQRLWNLWLTYEMSKTERGSLEEIAETVLAYADRNGIKLPERKEKTQLAAVVDYLSECAKVQGVRTQSLWMPVLPECLYLSELMDDTAGFDGTGWGACLNRGMVEAVIGKFDDPMNQRQGNVTVNLSQNGHLVVVGSAVSGKSVFLQTLLYALTQHYTPQELNIYAIDFSARFLLAFEEAPHVGGVVCEHEEERLAKLFYMMNRMLDERKDLLCGGNYSQYARAKGTAGMPLVLLVIDNYAAFRAKTNNRYEETLLRILNDGMGCGILLAVSAGGFGAMEIPTRLADHFRTVFCLEMGDRFQYAEAMRVTHVDILPEANVKGRGLLRFGEDLLEFQTALPLEAEDDFQRTSLIAAYAKKMRKAWTGVRARNIPEIPENPTWGQYVEMEDVQEMFADDRRLPIAYDVETAAVYGLDLSKIFCYLIAGKARSGKTNLLKILLCSACKKGGEVAVFDFEQEFSYLSGQMTFRLIESDEGMYRFFSELSADFKTRNEIKRRYVQKGLSDEELYAAMRQFPIRYLLIANLSDFLQHVQNPQGVAAISGFVENMLEKGSLHNVFLFAVLRQEDGRLLVGNRLYEAFVRGRNGIHFGGNLSGIQTLNFDAVSYAEQAKQTKAGVGMVSANADEEARRVLVPLWKA